MNLSHLLAHHKTKDPDLLLSFELNFNNKIL